MSLIPLTPGQLVILSGPDLLYHFVVLTSLFTCERLIQSTQSSTAALLDIA